MGTSLQRRQTSRHGSPNEECQVAQPNDSHAQAALRLDMTTTLRDLPGGATELDLSEFFVDNETATKEMLDKVGDTIRTALEKGEIFSAEVLEKTHLIRVKKAKGAKDGEVVLGAFDEDDKRVGSEYFLAPFDATQGGGEKVLEGLKAMGNKLW
ncbi:hypothetical protein K461DRAFT_311608 [Myriangium duriaei CBS 260.36]|uniref:Uncharacterized protein n=1 Tax=Myriangium duriaei CBS 260.36 TaxID=1168546 RepID=A0A9P4MHY0_9PEZI|nr:hypothetical protein K461DRAFT_311608 [Myriangium duriaei CBS 260.36]